MRCTPRAPHGPDQLGLCALQSVTLEATAKSNDPEFIAWMDDVKVGGTPQHGLPSKKMASITSDHGMMCCPSITWP